MGLCGHTCGCIINRKTGEKGRFHTDATGASLYNHRTNIKLHPNCGFHCPQFNKTEHYTSDLFENPQVYLPSDASLPAAFSSYSTFLSAYGSESGGVIEYRRVNGNIWEQIGLSTTQPQMTVADWNQWYQKAALLAPEDRVEALYLVNIQVRSHDHKFFQTDPITAILHTRGTMSISRYLDMFDDQMSVSDMTARLYLAPPWTGAVLTPLHFDGHGTQMSLHRVLMGDGHNLVHVWDTLPPFLDKKFRQIVGLPLADEPQALPHDTRCFIDSSDKVWDVEKEVSLRRWEIRSTTLRVAPGQSIILPPGKAHVFKKIGPSTEIPAGQFPIPLLGYSGDCSYVGSTAESFAKNWLLIKYAQQLLQKHRQGVYSFLDLAVLCLVRLGYERPDLLAKDSIMKEHFIGAIAPFKEFIQEEKRHMEAFATALTKNKQLSTIKLMDCDKARMELICDKCKCCLVNFHISSADTAWCYPCWTEKDHSDCGAKKVGGKKMKTKKNNTLSWLRFMTIDSLENLLLKQTNLG